MAQPKIELPALLDACTPRPRLRPRRDPITPTILVFGIALFLIAQMFLGG